MTDEAALARIARREKDPEIRASALAKVKDEKVLVEIALSDKDPWGYQAAIDRIQDEAALRRVLEARWSEPSVAQYIARRVKDQSTLAFILQRSRTTCCC